MLLSDLVTASRQLVATPARSAKIAALSDLLRRASPDEVETLVAWLSGRFRQGRIGLGPAAFEASEARSTGTGDLFATAEAAEARLSVSEVDAALERLAGLGGSGSASRRNQALGALLRRADEEEKEFLFRLAMGELRHGALEGLMEEAVAAAASVPLESVRRAAMLSGDLGAVARVALIEGPAALSRFHLTLFRPIQPMLAQNADDVADALGRLGRAAFETKLDGARVQVHKAGSEVRVYSRSLHDVTHAAPELVDLALRLPAQELVLDGEVVALDEHGRPHSFQITMRRFGRKLEVDRMRKELPLTPYLFDVLRVDSDDLLDRPYIERVAALDVLAGASAVARIVTADRDEAEAFYDLALEMGHEGVMAKAPDAAYQAGGRGFAWLKVKPAHTLDLVVLAAEWGHGRRSGWLSNLHLGARDTERGGFAMLGKTFKGMTDALLEWQTERLQELAVGREGHVVRVRPEMVVEIAFNDVQESPHYDSGLALRFARLKRYREDKDAGQADTLETVRAIASGTVRKTRIRS